MSIGGLFGFFIILIVAAVVISYLALARMSQRDAVTHAQRVELQARRPREQ